MELWTEALARITPALYTTEEIPSAEKLVVAKFFTPAAGWTWYVVEAEPQEDGDVLFFGLVDGQDLEWGYFTLNEFKDLNRSGDWRLQIERDLHITPLSRTIASFKEDAR